MYILYLHMHMHYEDEFCDDDHDDDVADDGDDDDDCLAVAVLLLRHRELWRTGRATRPVKSTGAKLNMSVNGAETPECIQKG